MKVFLINGNEIDCDESYYGLVDFALESGHKQVTVLFNGKIITLVVSQIAYYTK